MGDVKDLGKERQKRVLLCMYCGKAPADDHPGYSCPRIASLCVDEDGHIWQVEFHDWQEVEKGDSA
jgi:hypothetical protein